MQYVSVGLFWAAIGVNIVMGAGVVGGGGGGQTQPTNLHEYTQEARPHSANSTANERQSIGAAPQLASEAGKPILCSFWEPSSLT